MERQDTMTRTPVWAVCYKVLQTLLFPEEVIRGHRNRFIAHRRIRGHVVRVVYEYEGKIPVVVGEGVYEDQVLS